MHADHEIELGYGRGAVKFGFDESRFSVFAANANHLAPLSDFEVGAALDRVNEIVDGNDSVLIVASDATRATASAQIVNLLVRRLIQAGVSPANLAIIFATGIHRPVSDKEKVELLTPFVVQRLRILDHDAYDPAQLTTPGTTDTGVPVEVNRALKEFSRVIVTGGVTFHYFAGFTGGRKSICPGLASARTIEATHMLAMDFERGGRAAGVRAGSLEGNPVHEECERVATLIAPAFGINTIVDENKRAVKIFCGDWRLAHRAACDYYLNQYSVAIPEKRDIVIVSCGGFPHDINMIQAHKALDMAALACNDGGTIILLAECSDGLGRPDFLKWFDEPDSRALEARLFNGYEVNGQTAWALLTKAERHRVCLISELPPDDVKRMRMIPVKTISEALEDAGSGNGFIMPRGAALLPRVQSTDYADED
ncbi:MAG TPA: nickel-dependent lactate racemase [Pyrinomonadaceae bacterium]|nr:nickel-dependent lactate racemase [Pyrinomonadaceae bacterium]